MKALTKPGTHGDGDGLYLQVTSATSKSWIFRYQLDGRRREMGLGSIADVSLAAAREQATEARKQVAQGVDPIQARKAAKAAQRAAEAQTVTFKQAAEDFIDRAEAGWRNTKHRAQWRATLNTYAYPILGDTAVGAVDTTLVLKVLEQSLAAGTKGKKAPLWIAKPETASRMRGRIEAVLSAAKARGLRAGENPAQWRGHLDQLLPPRSKVRRVRHQPALPYPEIPKFMARLAGLDSVSARALELTILTAVRTGETTGAVWAEFDRDGKLWTVPAERMKANREHRVPLSDAAAAIVEKMAKTRLSRYVFPGAHRNKPLSDMALLECLRGLRKGYTVHGFRSSFRDWAAEQTAFPNIVAEAALAHIVADKTEAAYRRGDLLEKRRELMNAWAVFCLGQRSPAA